MNMRHLGLLPVAMCLCASVAMGQQYMISTFAGNGSEGYTGDSGPATAAQLAGPGAVAVDSKGNVFIADANNHVVREVSGGNITTVAGNNTMGYSGDGGPATKAQLSAPAGVAVDSSGNLYIADTGNSVIRKVTAGGTISTFAGYSGNGAGYGGDGGSATAVGVYFWSPAAVALDSAGNLYIADSGNRSIRKVSNGNLSTVVGVGSTATRLNSPTGVVVDTAGNLYIADTLNHRIAKFSPSNGTLVSFAGNGQLGFSGDNGPATAASLSDPNDVALDAAGNVYISDTLNGRIRKVSTTGIITTIAGNGRIGYTGDGGLATAAALNFPHGLTVDASGKIYVADYANNVVRLLTPVQAATPVITANGVVNAASMAPRISPGCLATVFGSNFAAAAASANPPLPLALGGVSVTVNGQQAPVLFVNSTQVNFQVPWETKTGTASIAVNVNSNVSQPVTVPVAAAGPGLFAVVQNADYSINSPSNPASQGSTIMAYLTGSGPVSPPVANGVASPSSPLANTTATATIGGEAAEVSFAGLTPGLVGVLQANVVVPLDLSSGDYPLVVTINGEDSNPFTVSVQFTVTVQ